jgi:hypothetical protein
VGQSQWTTQGSDIYYATGAVSIGTQATSSQLHVLNSTGDNILKLSRGASTSTILRVGTDGALVIQNQATDVLTIKSGNVGIGTTSPNSPLTVGSAVTTNLSPIINANSTGNRPIFVGETSGNKGVMIGYTGNDIQGRSGTNFTTNGDLVLNYYGGNVGIGTTTTTEKLTVNGNVEATAYYYPSDARLKVNIAPVGGLEVVRGLNGVSFTWRDSGKPGVGFIAQDVERVLPAAVATSPQTGMKSVDYAVIIAPLVEAVKDLDRQVAELRQEVNELKNK